MDTGSDCTQPLKSLEEFQRANNSIKCHRENKNDSTEIKPARFVGYCN